ncbi:MAG: leucine-rich repeat protein [Ruminococcus sp.]|nr:leucine-rich repeat protein [Ruminococcus sp.]
MVCYKKLIAAAVSLLLCGVSALPAAPVLAEEESAVAQEILSSEGFSYVLDSSGNAIIIGMDAKDGTVDIPSSLDGHTVTELDADAFSDTDASVVEIPASIQYISTENPFTRCESLTAVNVDGANEDYCSVDGVLYSKDKTSLLCCPPNTEGSSFAVPEGVTAIGVAAFYNCKFTKITLPGSLTEIKRHAFSTCEELTAADLSSTKVETIGDMAFAQCSALSDVKLPESLTVIGSGAFALCGSLTEIELPDGLTQIGQSAFMATGLSRIVIPSSVEEIGYCAFGYDEEENMDESFLIVGDSGSAAEIYATDTDEDYGIANNFQFITTEAQNAIDEHAAADTKIVDDIEYAEENGEAVIYFCYSSDTSVTVPAQIDGLKVTKIKDYAFYSCPAEVLTLPDSVETIGAFAFPPTVKELNLPGSLKELAGEEPFISCTELTAINVGQGDGEFSSLDGVLYNKDKTKLIAYPIAKPDESFTAPAGLKEIGFSAFCNNLHLKRADLTGVETIATYAFDGCAALNYVKLSKSLKTVSNDAFYGCPNLKSVRLYKEIETIGDYAFGYLYDPSSIQQTDEEQLYDMLGLDDGSEEKDASVVNEGFKIYADKGSLGYAYAKACGIETVTGTVLIGEKNVSIGFLCTIGGIILAIILGIIGFFTGKKLKAKKEEKKRAEARAKAAQKLREKKAEQEKEEQ